MIFKKLWHYGILINNIKNSQKVVPVNFVRIIHKSQIYCDEDGKKQGDPKAIVPRDPFQDVKDKNRNTYLEMVRIFVNRDHVYRRGHVEFIHSALKHMEEFGVHKDLEVYRSLIDVMPKGKFIPTNIIQAEFMHYPKQQQCIIDLLEQMEENGVMPDYDMEDLLLNIFGKRGYPVRRFWRMMYWMPKFKNLSPWPVPDPLPDDIFELAKIAIERISSVDVNNKLTVYQSSDIKDSIDDTWIVSAQSKTQKRLLSENKLSDPVYVEGHFKVWIKGRPINYFMLRGSARPFSDDFVDTDDVTKIKSPLFNFKPPVADHLKVIPSVHEQKDGVVYALCATGTSSKDSLLSWIRHLENEGNPILANLPIVFTLRSGTKEVANLGSSVDEEKQIESKDDGNS